MASYCGFDGHQYLKVKNPPSTTVFEPNVPSHFACRVVPLASWVSDARKSTNLLIARAFCTFGTAE